MRVSRPDFMVSLESAIVYSGVIMNRFVGSGRYANITATMALVVALGGTSYAATALPRNSVGSAQIKNRAVANADIKNSSVTSVKVKDMSLLARDFKVGELPGGPAGPTGATGATGATGPAGPAGAAGSARAYGEVRIDASSNFELVPGTSKNVVAIGQAGGGNPAACIQLDPSIDASSAIAVATSNNRSGAGQAFNTQIQIARPLVYCGGVLSNVVEVVTTQTNVPGAAVKGAFVFAVM